MAGEDLEGEVFQKMHLTTLLANAYRIETRHDTPVAISLPRAEHKQRNLGMSDTRI